MQRGVTAAAEAAGSARRQGAGVRTTLARAADAWANSAGGASGALWNLALHALASVLSDDARPTKHNLADGLAAAANAVQSAGKAEPGDKTMVDAMHPFALAFGTAVKRGASVVDAWMEAVEAATHGAESTASMVARVGRARPHAEKSLGTQDPGAASFVILVRAVLPVLKESAPTEPSTEKRRA
jgi:dihydroxyacetone kinase